jgi:hypothetical protein
MATAAQDRLFEALKAHTSQLEAERESASGRNRMSLDRRLKATHRLSEWLSIALASNEPLISSNSIPLKHCSRSPLVADRHR